MYLDSFSVVLLVFFWFTNDLSLKRKGVVGSIAFVQQTLSAFYAI